MSILFILVLNASETILLKLDEYFTFLEAMKQVNQLVNGKIWLWHKNVVVDNLISEMLCEFLIDVLSIRILWEL